MPAFDKRVSDFEAVNTQVLGISTDSPFSHENWAKAVGISHYPLLSDVHRTVVNATPASTMAAPPICHGPISSPTSRAAIPIPTTGVTFMKMAARLGPTRSTAAYHQRWATAPGMAWYSSTIQARAEARRGRGVSGAVTTASGSSTSVPHT